MVPPEEGGDVRHDDPVSRQELCLPPAHPRHQGKISGGILRLCVAEPFQTRSAGTSGSGFRCKSDRIFIFYKPQKAKTLSGTCFWIRAAVVKGNETLAQMWYPDSE